MLDQAKLRHRRWGTGWITEDMRRIFVVKHQVGVVKPHFSVGYIIIIILSVEQEKQES